MNSSRYQKNAVADILGAVVLAVVINGSTLAESRQPADRAAKDIFYRPSEDSGTPTPRLALNYKILLKHGGAVTQVPTDYAFKSGDCFRLVFQTNAEGYVYLLHKGSTGNGRFLFPDPRIDGGKNHVTAYEEHVVPATGWFRFDDNTGTETIHVIVTVRPLPDFLRLLSNEEIQPWRWERVVESFLMTYRRCIGQRQTKDIVYVEAGQEFTRPTQTVVQQAPPSVVMEPVAQSTGGNSTPPATPSPGVESDAATVGLSHVVVTQPAGQLESHWDQSLENLVGSGNTSGAGQRQAECPNPEEAGNHTVQVFVAQAETVAGEQNVLVHTISLNHN